MAHFNVLTAAAFVPAAFTALVTHGPLAWNGALSFWLKNLTVGVWIVVMTVVLAQAIYRERARPWCRMRATARTEERPVRWYTTIRSVSCGWP